MTITTSYVNLKELEECVISYFDKTLDLIPKNRLIYLALDPRDLFPGNALRGIIDSNDISKGLKEIALEHRLTLKAYYGGDSIAFSQLESFTNRLGRNELIVEALTELARYIHRSL
jgi:hypothetical protein